MDFLGNPLGFVNDVTEGVSGLIYEGSVKTLVKNVTHGISNSAAKVTESLSDGLGRVIMDERHEEARQRIRANTAGSSDHLVAGLKGFGFGLLGGVTSIFKQTYDGATNEGFPVRFLKFITIDCSKLIINDFRAFSLGLVKELLEPSRNLL